MNIEPGEGYRLLERGELLKDQDEMHMVDGWRPIRTHFGMKAQDATFRRKIEPPEQGWMPIGGHISFPCWCWSPEKGVPDVAFNAAQVTYGTTHWRPAQVPAPPPVEDPVDKAFDEWKDTVATLPGVRAAFKAGAQWAKQQK